MNKYRIYHNPRCSKSRETLALLEQNGVQPEIVEYLKTPLTPDEIKHLADMLHVAPRGIMRTKEAEYKAQNLADESLSDAALINAIAKTPKLLERPIVVKGEQAVIGRPPENVLTIID
ncbi:arsenate reductase (glutaredoxin) [Echinimonas agarilytica]|uniref:Arsenate reductase n=1 Tax=Echinimonas agarilytica TaxID=1215918 RepID=A0AA41W5P6_9GAMM|nr:arsenate reductase (glutaredoxin) [Echinimonas agarilytica]MCM2679281.1 arsenate reductase (glutaredoxin) [Echinimonas agarilytica]